MEDNRKKLLAAIQSKDKAKIKEALQKSKPITWLCYSDYGNGKLSYLHKDITKEELQTVFTKWKKSIKLILFKFA